MSISIDLNSDLGEHSDSHLDEQIMPYITSCNIACGGHVGDATSVKKTIELAMKHHVAIGAHPSFPDKENFGREVMSMNLEDLRTSVLEQVQLVKSSCEEMKINLHHIKPHGALYNLAANDEKISTMLCELLLALDPKVKLYGLAHSITERVAVSMNIDFVGEAFADRSYEMDKTLRSRKKKGAVIEDEEMVLRQVEELVCSGRVTSEEWLSISAQTICLHSDTKGAVNLAKSIRNHLEQKGVHIRSV